MILDDAIRQQRLVAFRYHGEDRVVQPHIHGELQRGAEALSGVQVAGGSHSGELGWKTFLVDELDSAPTLAGRFSGPDPAYNPRDPAFRRIFSKL
jgi:hypothetical protein